MQEGLLVFAEKHALSPLVVWSAYAVIIVLVALVTGVLIYHWQVYGLRDRVRTVTYTVFFTGAAVCLITGCVSLLLYSM